jgi:hypothetical protein
MKSVLVITFSNLKTDNRVKRQVSFLQSLDLSVTVASNDGLQLPGTSSIQLKNLKLNWINKLKLGILLIFKFYEQAYNLQYGNALKIDEHFDLIVANDIEALPLAFSLKKKAKILFDAHEYAPRHFEDRLIWRIFFQGFNQFLCKKYIPFTDAMITVGQRIAEEYHNNYGVNPVVITNAPDFIELEPKKTNPAKIKLIHQGSANPSRKLELMITMMELLDERFELDLMLLKPPVTHRTSFAYYQKLEKLLVNNQRVRLVPPTSSEKLIEALHEYDMGIILIPPVNFNYANTLPNKFFECIQSRIALAIAPTPEIAQMTKDFNIGIVSSDFTPKSLAAEIAKVTAEQIDSFKKNTLSAAREFNANRNRQLFKEIINSIHL